MNVYPVREDTYFLLNFLAEKDLDSKRILEMGAGNGLISISLAEEGAKVTAADINEDALDQIEEKAIEKDLGIKTIKSDLFENIEDKFDVIVFNPPYLPGKNRFKEDEKWRGGKEGIEITQKFLEDVNTYLTRKGSFYVIASSLANFEALVDKYDLEVLAEKQLWFEKLYILGK